MRGLIIFSQSSVFVLFCFYQEEVTAIGETAMLPWVVPQSGWRRGRAPPEFSQS